MSTFSEDYGVLSETWNQEPGVGGLPRWSVSGICLDTPATRMYLERHVCERVQFTVLPNARELIAKPLNGQTLVTVVINPLAGQRIPFCVQLPVSYSEHAGTQPAGTPHAGYRLLNYRTSFQQTLWNHLT